MFRVIQRVRTGFVGAAFVAVLACSATVQVFAGSTTAVDNEIEATSITNTETLSARSLFISSGLQKLVKQVPTSTVKSLESVLSSDNLPSMFSNVAQNDIRSAVQDAFKFETFDKFMVKQLRNGMTTTARTEILRWYASDLGSKVREAELSNSLLTEHERFEDFQRLIDRYPVSDRRKELVTQLDKTMRSTESAIDMMMNIQIAFSLSLSQVLPAEQRITREQIVEMVRQSRNEFADEYQEQTKQVLLFTYQDLNDEQLQQFEAVLAKDSGQAFVTAINEGIKKAMFAASLDLGDNLGALVSTKVSGHGI